MSSQQFNVVGKRTPRKDGLAKVTGREVYASDVYLPNMMYAKILRSPHAHAVIKRIDASEAEAMGAVCFTYADAPKLVYNERVHSNPDYAICDRTVLTDKARHVGEPILAVAAATEDLALRALRKVKVEYEVLPAVFEPEDAVAERGGARLYDTVYRGGEALTIRQNICADRVLDEGDVDEGFKEAEVVVEADFETQPQYHAQLEPKAVVVRPEADGGITVWASTQTIHGVRILLGRLYDLPLSKVNVKRVTLGGGFGSGIHVNPIIPICTGLALKAKRPVKLLYSREDDMYDHVKYPVKFHLKVGARRDGTLVAFHGRSLINMGAHHVQAYSFIGAMAGWANSLYKWGTFRFEGRAVYTNRVPACAMQGYGNPQVNFAAESLMDMLAEELGMDPLQLRLKNYKGVGDEFWGQGPTVKSIIRTSGVEEMCREGARLIKWDQRTPPAAKSGDLVQGIGMARGFHCSGTGGPSDETEVVDYSGATIKINEDGSVDVITALMDLGGGTWEAAAKVTAEVLQVPLEQVGISPADTRTTVYDVCTHATRGVYVACGAIYRVALKVREQLLAVAARILSQNPSDLTLVYDEELGQAVVYPTGLPDRRLTVGQIARTAWLRSWGTISHTESYRAKNSPPCFVTHFVEVEVNQRTGQVRVTRVVAMSDSGTPINPDSVEGQLIGGFARGMGYALLEDTPLDPSGRLACHGQLVDYKLPTVMEMPKTTDFQTFLADVYEPTGPLGAKGIGEAALNSVAAAIANAIYNATGIRFRELPITPEKILAALRDRESSPAGC